MDTPQELSTDALNPDSKYTSCPYNRSHRILRGRMQYHLVKCKRSVKEKPEDEKNICPFDATHHVDKEEYDEHVKTCPNRKIIDSEKYTLETEPKPEDEPAASYNFPELPPCEENWDDPSEPAYTYDPTAHLENQPILRTMHGATKSERKAFRQIERIKMIQFNSGQPMDTAAAASAAGVNVQNGKIVGHGRGQSRLPLGRGNSVGAVGGRPPLDLDKLVGDEVGHILPCPVEAGPLRQPRGTSLALMMARLGEETPVREEIPAPSPSTGAIRKVRQPQVQSEENFPKEDEKAQNSRQEEKPRRNEQHDRDERASSKANGPKTTDWWNVGQEIQKQPSVLLEEYKEQTMNSRLAVNLGIISKESERSDDERARDFTYKDEEWTLQCRRGRRGAGRRGRV